MTLALEILAALALLFAGGEGLVRGSASLALRLGFSRLAIGATVVAFGTSTPELVVSLGAALAGSGDIALGNVVGSNIANIALILGLTALVRPLAVHSRMLRLDIPLMVALAVLLVVLLATVGVPRLAGAGLLALLAGFVWLNLAQSRREASQVKEEFASAARPGRLAWALTGVIAGLGGLILGGRLFVGAAVEVAAALGLSDATIGLTIVAVGTSLPELVTSLVAALRGQIDIVIGNVVGSNVFNIVGILGATAMVEPLARGGIGWFDLGAMVACAAVLMVMAITDRRLDRREGLVLGLLYAGYTAALVAG